jgi:hypothetical protein
MILSIALVLSSCLNAAAAPSAPLNTARIEALTGLKGAFDATQEVFKVSYPRADIEATIAGVKAVPAMGLTAWAAFTKKGAHAMVMGDLVLLEDQVNPVMSAALDNDLDVTALHNHFLWDSPRVMFMHIGGMGDQEKLARAVGAVFAKLKETSGGKAAARNIVLDRTKTIDPAKIDAILGKKGDLAGGVYKTVFGKKSKMGGLEIGAAMGVNTWAAFIGGDDLAVVDGDFAMYEPEMQGVLKALRRAGIDVVAIHSHMAMETPRVLFLHYWGVGTTTDLAKGLKAALDAQK